MSTKTLRKRIALVAVSAMGFGLLSVVPASAAITVAQLNLLTAGSTTAVTAGASDGADTAYVRSGASSQTFVVQVAAAAEDAEDFDLVLATTGTLASVASATTVNLTGAAVIASGETGTATTNTLAQGIGAVSTDRREAAVLLPAGTTAVDKVSITTGALAAGTYYLWADPSPGDAITTGGLLIATITSYDVGAPVSMSYNIDGLRQVGSAADESTLLTSKVYDSTGRQTFLVGSETITHSFSNPVTAPVSNAMTNPGTTDASSAPTPRAGAKFDGYTVPLDLTATSGTTAGTIYTLTGVILNGVNAFGNDTMTYVNSATTNGLAGSLTLTNAVSSISTGVVVTSIALANSQATTAANYVLTAKDSDGRVIKGVTPVLTASAGTVTTAVGTTVAGGTDSTFVYTAPATGTSATLTFTMFGGSAGNTTLSVPVSVGATYFTSDYAAEITGTGNGGALDGTTTEDYNLTSGGTTYTTDLDPANTTSVTADFYLYEYGTSSAFGDPVSGASITASIDNTAGTAIPIAQRTLAASALTTDSTGKATATIAVTSARNTETLTVKFSSGTSVLGTATFTFTSAATTIAELSVGPANAITQQAGTATAITVTATDQYGQAAANKRVQLSMVGPSSSSTGTLVVVTNASGVANYTVTGTTAVTGQTDTLTITNFDGGSSLTAGANDVVAISYVATAPVVSTFSIAGALTQENTASAATYTTYTTATLADAIGVANNTALAGTKFEDKKFLPIDSLGNYTDTATKSGATAADQDEVVGLRFRALNASSVALAGIPLVVTASTGAWVVGSLGQAVSTRTLYTNASGYIYVNAFATATGDATWTVTQGAVSASISVTYANDVEDARFVSVSPATKSVTSGTLAQFVATVTDRYGNVVPGATVTWSELGAGRLEANSGATSATGTSTADFSTYATETGAGVVKAVIAYQGEDLASYVGATKSSYTNGLLIAAAAAGIASSSAAITVDAPTTKSAELLASEANAAAIAAIAAKAASDKAESDAKIALLQAALDAAATKAAADKLALEASIAASQAAAVAAAEAAADAAAEAIDAGNNAFDAATTAGEAAESAQGAAEQAGEDAVAAAQAAGEAAVAASEAAQEAAAEATDAANAATDAANASAEAADAATAAAQDAADAVAALSTQVSEMITALKKQITALTNLVIKIQKKVKA